MVIVLKLKVFGRTLKLFDFLAMSKNTEKVFYAVGRGKEVGIFDTWKECKERTEGVHNAKFRKFYSYKDAEEFVNFWKNYLTPAKESLLSEDFMETQENVDICEDTKNFDVQPVGTQPAAVVKEETPIENQSCCMPCSQFSPSKLPSVEGRTDQKNADIIAFNLRLDSFERRFDTCLKEIGAIVAEISRLKSDVKDLKESLSSTPKKGSTGSPDKTKDGKVQTTLCFNSSSSNNNSTRLCSVRDGEGYSEESGIKERRNLKRKLSGSNLEKSRRSSDDIIDDLLKRFKTGKVDHSSFTLDEDDYVEVYTDGSALSNGKGNSKAGIGIWFGDNHPLNVAEPVVGPPTNNTAEIQAARVAMQLAINEGITKLKIFTDSEFLINCATKWVHRWEKNGWTLRDGGPVKHRKELEKLQKAASKISIRWEKVPAHSNIKGNEAADRLANEGALKYS